MEHFEDLHNHDSINKTKIATGCGCEDNHLNGCDKLSYSFDAINGDTINFDETCLFDKTRLKFGVIGLFHIMPNSAF